jgi:cytosine permease
MLVGATVAAATPQRPEVFTWLADKGGIIAVLATIFMFINLGSVCSHCLYNAAVGWAHLTKQKYRLFAVIFGAIGTVIAMTNAWQHFFDWLIFLGIIVPPIAAVILADHMLPWSRHAGHDAFDLSGIQVIRYTPFISWIIGSGVAMLVNYQAPQFSTVICGFIAAVVAYAIIERVTPAPDTSKAPSLSPQG